MTLLQKVLKVRVVVERLLEQGSKTRCPGIANDLLDIAVAFKEHEREENFVLQFPRNCDPAFDKEFVIYLHSAGVSVKRHAGHGVWELIIY